MTNKDHLERILILLLITILSFSSDSFSQVPGDCDLCFINHLIDRGDYNAALFLIDSSECKVSENNDSLHYLKGWCMYYLQNLAESATSFLRVHPSSSFYAESRFFSAYNNIHIGDLEAARNILGETHLNDDKLVSLRNFELSGISLLQNDLNTFEEFIRKADRNRYEISGSVENLEKLSDQIRTHKDKSAFLAGVLSGFLPGAGKLYAGKKGEAVAAFFSTAGLGAVTYENYGKNGIDSFTTVAFGTAFLFSYIANIYGAVLSVRVLENEYDEHVKNTILFNLHIPLRNTFNK